MPNAHALSNEEYRQLGEIVRLLQAKGHLLDHKIVREITQRNGFVMICALLESISSGQTGKAAVLRKGIEGRERQLVDLRGEISGDEFFSLTLEGYGTTEAIPATATPVQMREAIEGLDGINPGDIIVQLGTHKRSIAGTLTEFSLRRWIVEFTGQFAGQDIPLIEAAMTSSSGPDGFYEFATTEDTLLVDSGRTEIIYAPIPVGSPTPLRPPAICVCVKSDEFGWVIVAIEPRGILSSVY